MPGGLAGQGRGHRGLSLIPPKHLTQGAALWFSPMPSIWKGELLLPHLLIQLKQVHRSHSRAKSGPEAGNLVGELGFEVRRVRIELSG